MIDGISSNFATAHVDKHTGLDVALLLRFPNISLLFRRKGLDILCQLRADERYYRIRKEMGLEM